MEPETTRVREAIRRVQASVARSTSPGDAEDLVQEALARAVRHGVDVDAEPWLRTVARRIAIDRSRRVQEVASGDGADLERMLAHADPTPEDHLVSQETAETVRRALATLPVRYREALVAYMEEDESAARVAHRFNLSSNAAWSLLHRARARMRLELERGGYVASAIFARLTDWEHNERAGAAAAAVAAVVIGLVGAGSLVDGPDASADPSAAAPAIEAQSPAEALPDEAAGLAAPLEAGTVSPGVDLPAVDVPEAPEIVVHYSVKACLFREDRLPVEAGVTIEEPEEGRSVMLEAVSRLPEPVRQQERSLICRPVPSGD